MTDLDKLIKAVEGEAEAHVVQIFAKRLSSAAIDRGDYWPSHDVEKAFRGSLDAAKALHNALLPGWGVETAVSGGHSSALVFIDGYRDDYSEKWETLQGGNVARAWLLSILKAYRSQQ